MGSATDEQVSRLAHSLQAAADPARAPQQQAYLKSPLTHLGVGLPAMRTILREWVRDQGDLSRGGLWTLVDPLWRSPTYELRSCGVEALAYRSGLLTVDDLSKLRQMISGSFTWALVDPLSTDVVGAIVAEMDYPAADAALDPWSVDESFWVRRASMLCQLRLLRNSNYDPTRFFRYADAMLEEREFFIRKAIGWVLRDMSRKRPDLVFSWFLPRAQRASGTTAREAVKYLTADQRAQIAALRS